MVRVKDTQGSDKPTMSEQADCLDCLNIDQGPFVCISTFSDALASCGSSFFLKTNKSSNVAFAKIVIKSFLTFKN